MNIFLEKKEINGDKNNENLNIINLKLKAENEQKEKKIEILSKKINELEINLRDAKNVEKVFLNENKKNLEIIEKQEKEINQLKQ